MPPVDDGASDGTEGYELLWYLGGGCSNPLCDNFKQ